MMFSKAQEFGLDPTMPRAFARESVGEGSDGEIGEVKDMNDNNGTSLSLLYINAGMTSRLISNR